MVNRIEYFLNTGKILQGSVKRKSAINMEVIAENTVIEPNVVCSEKHRAFFIEKIGKSFSFNVLFQKWLKSNAGLTYGDAIEAYYQILEEKKKGKHILGSFLRPIREEVWKKRLHIGNIKKVYQDITIMKNRIL